ncbi:unnamed protein product [Orchesella dallaii]|uniref:Uncharacterized protein n=1 Tax=Orchesella dallaii TaxID=48710 RepID=A0ABP1PSY8_9HEXA
MVIVVIQRVNPKIFSRQHALTLRACYAIINPSGATLEESSSDGSWMVKCREDTISHPNRLTFVETDLMNYLAECTFMHILDPTYNNKLTFKVVGANLEHADCGNLMVAVESEAKDHDVLIRKGEAIARLVFTQIGRPKPLHVNSDALQDYLEKLITHRRQLCYISTLRYGPFSVIPSVILDNNNNDHCTIPSLQDDPISSTPTDLLQSTSGVNNKSSTSLTDMSEHSTQPTASAMSNDVKLKGEDKFNVIVAHALSAMIRTDIGPLKADMDTLKCLVNNAIKVLIPTPSIGEVEDGDTTPPIFNRHAAAKKVKLAPEI